jgi:nicotinamide-nucleotide amidase
VLFHVRVTLVFSDQEIEAAAALLARCRARGIKIATAESCTGGLVAALLTEVPGSSDVFERGFVTYSNGAKCDLLGVPATLIGRYGAVSAEVAVAMASGALAASIADLSVSVTGVAGPSGGTVDKPVGLVHLAAQMRGHRPVSSVLTLGAIGRGPIRMQTAVHALALLAQALDSDGGAALPGTP